MAPETRLLISEFSAGRISAIDVRRRLGGATYGDLLRMVASEGLTLPRSAEAGREQLLATARAWMFPDHAA